jgi:mannose-6-phosphate isomerase-like protein (cupin superfamily)
LNKEVKIVNMKDIEPKVVARGVRVKRLITKRREGSDRIMLGIGWGDPASEEVWRYSVKDEVYFVLRGGLTLFWSDNTSELRDGDAVYLPAGIKYRLVYHKKDNFIIYALSPPLE